VQSRRPTHHFGRYYSPRTGRAHLCPQPSKKSVQRMIGEIREATDRKTTWQGATTMVKQINRKLAGWGNYFNLGPVSKAYRAIDRYTATHYAGGYARSIRLAARRLHGSLTSTSTIPWGSSYCSRKLIASRERTPDVLSESRMRDPRVRFDERGEETERCRMAQATAPLFDSTGKPDHEEDIERLE
jgi:hypothetical protein